eukprot:358811-Chlamydomonas_euryale.AAC.12
MTCCHAPTKVVACAAQPPARAAHCVAQRRSSGHRRDRSLGSSAQSYGRRRHAGRDRRRPRE